MTPNLQSTQTTRKAAQPATTLQRAQRIRRSDAQTPARGHRWRRHARGWGNISVQPGVAQPNPP
eukprot:3728497-Lingulodinium_polyedra.AAC.1